MISASTPKVSGYNGGSLSMLHRSKLFVLHPAPTESNGTVLNTL